MYARIQTWFPFNIQVGLNGREWLARQMDVQRQLFLRIDDNYFSRSTTITFSRLRSAAKPGGQSRLRPGSSVLGIPSIDPSRSVGHYRLPGAIAVIFS
jgi:hypothetical protein